METDILIEAPDWDAIDLEGLTLSVCTAALSDLGLDPERFAVSLLACDDARIAELNAGFRGKAKATNVLSWPSQERGAETPGTMPNLPRPEVSAPPFELGDVALAYQTCKREAEEAGRPFEHHVAHLVAHGLLHLLGFDHENDADAELMEKLETRVLASLGVPDPY